MKKIHFYIMSIFLLSSTPLLAQETDRSIHFYDIDDKAKVYVDDKEVFDSGFIGHKDIREADVDLSKYIISGDEEIKIELYNAVCPDCTTNPWSITYEIFEDDEDVDYQYEKGRGDGNDEVPIYSYTFVWNDL